LGEPLGDGKYGQRKSDECEMEVSWQYWQYLLQVFCSDDKNLSPLEAVCFVYS